MGVSRMTEQVENLNIQEDVVSLKIENKALMKVIIDLEGQIEKMKTDVRHEQSHWNSGEMQFDLFQRLLDKWE